MRKPALLVFIIIAVFGSYYLTQIKPSYQPSSAGSRSDVPDEYYQPDDHKPELLSALGEVGNHTLAYLPNSRSGLLMVVDLDSGSVLGSCKLGEFGRGPFNILFTTDSTLFLCPFPKLDVVRIYDSHTFDMVGSISVDDYPTNIIGDDDYAYVFSEESAISIIDLDEMKAVETIQLEEGPEDGVISSDGFIYFSNDYGITKLDPRNLSSEKVVSIVSEESQIAVNNDGSVLFAAFCETYESTWTLHIYDTVSWDIIHVAPNMTERLAPDGRIYDMTLTLDDNLIYSDPDSGLLYIMNSTTFDLVRTTPAEIYGLHWEPTGIFITPDGEYVCTLSSGGIAIEGGSVDTPSGLLVMDSEYNWIHEIRLGDYTGVDFLAFK